MSFVIYLKEKRKKQTMHVLLIILLHGFQVKWIQYTTRNQHGPFKLLIKFNVRFKLTTFFNPRPDVCIEVYLVHIYMIE